MRDLLGDAVDISASQKDLPASDANDLAIRKKSGKQVHGRAVMRVVEKRHDDTPVSDIEIDIGRGQPITGLAGFGRLAGIQAFAFH